MCFLKALLNYYDDTSPRGTLRVCTHIVPSRGTNIRLTCNRLTQNVGQSNPPSIKNTMKASDYSVLH